MTSLVHFQRRAGLGHFSIERLFAEVRAHLPARWQAQVEISPHFSRGLLLRLKNLAACRRKAGGINHIVGDVHYLAFALSRKGLVLTIHDCEPLNRLKGWKREVLRQCWYVRPMRRAAIVTTISETTKQELHRWVGPLAEKVVVIPNCVNEAFQPTQKPFPSNPVVLQVGTGWNKNLARVLEALRGTPCRLEVVGELREGQQELLESSGIPFRALGKVTDDGLVDAYRRCDLVIFASLYEGFGLPVLEAQASGRPLITSNRSSLPEAAGDGALLVDPESVSEIRGAVHRLIVDADLRVQLVQRGLENVERYRPQAIAQRYAEVYDKVAAAMGN